jgi:hypothetical protein
MANLVITVIAIALVAVASLMGAYYGGFAFLNNGASVRASTFIQQGQQLAGDWQAYLLDNAYTAPTDVTALITGNYLTQLPTPPLPAGGTTAVNPILVTIGGSGTYVLYQVGIAGVANEQICQRVTRAATGASLTATPNSGDSSLGKAGLEGLGNGAFGCGIESGTGTTGNIHWNGTEGTTVTGTYVMFYRLY